ncbi:MAG: hypothetical protein ACRDY3_06410 [Acidimicrobiales bacterium]
MVENPDRRTWQALEALVEAGLGAGVAAVAARGRRLVLRVLRGTLRSSGPSVPTPSSACFARIEGTVENQRVGAIVRQDGSVAGDRPLLDRARLVASIGDTFDGGRLPAGVGTDPLPSALTLVRACDRVQSVQMVVPAAGRPSRLHPVGQGIPPGRGAPPGQGVRAS